MKFNCSLRFLAGLACMVVFAGCGSAIHYSTMLSSTGNLASGNPVYLNGMQVGSVTSVNPLPSGSSEVSFKVDRAHAPEVHMDSVMLLHPSPSPASLELLTLNPSSEMAPARMLIPGAADPNEARMIMGGAQAGNLVQGMAQALTALGMGLTNPALPIPSNRFSQELQEAERAALSAGPNGQTIAQQQLPRLERDFAEAQKQIAAQGSVAEARQLRQRLDTFAKTWGLSPARSGPLP